VRREARRAATLRFTTAAPSRARPVLVFLFIGLIGYSLSQVSIWRADADEPPLDRYLNDVAVLPAIRLGISRRNLNVGSLSFGFCCIHPGASIPLLNHSWVSLAIRYETHHQLRDTHRQRFVLVGMPRVPCLPIGMGKPLHQRKFSTCGKPTAHVAILRRIE